MHVDGFTRPRASTLARGSRSPRPSSPCCAGRCFAAPAHRGTVGPGDTGYQVGGFPAAGAGTMYRDTMRLLERRRRIIGVRAAPPAAASTRRTTAPHRSCLRDRHGSFTPDRPGSQRSTTRPTARKPRRREAASVVASRDRRRLKSAAARTAERATSRDLLILGRADDHGRGSGPHAGGVAPTAADNRQLARLVLGRRWALLSSPEDPHAPIAISVAVISSGVRCGSDRRMCGSRPGTR